MGSVAFQFVEAQASLFQPGANANATPAAATPPVLNQNQGTLAPQDSVTLSSQATQLQQTKVQQANGANASAKPVNRPAVPTLPVLLQNAPPRQTAPQQSRAQPTIPQQESAQQQAPPQQQPVPQQAAQQAAAPVDAANGTTSNQNAATAAAAQNAASYASAAAGPQTPQQQLTQLDQSLQGLGISPQSIPLSTRMAMLIYSNDPAALRLLVSQLQSSNQTSNTGNGAAAANPTQAQGSTQALLPAQSQGAPQPQTQNQSQAATVAPASAAAQPTVTQDNLGNGAANAPPPQTAAPANAQPANRQPTSQQTNAFALQLSNVQSTFVAVEQQGASQGSSETDQPSAGLNITV
jgi:hypothetical protein